MDSYWYYLLNATKKYSQEYKTMEMKTMPKIEKNLYKPLEFLKLSVEVEKKVIGILLLQCERRSQGEWNSCEVGKPLPWTASKGSLP